MRTDILGVAFDNTTMDEAVGRALTLAGQDGPHMVVTPNAEIVQYAGAHPEFSALLAEADLVLPDGVGVVYASRILGRPLQGRIPGIDFAAALMARMAETGLRLFLLGAKPGVAQAAADRLGAAYPGLCICGVHDGYFQDNEAVTHEIRAARADVLFVCLGSPKQEQWMAQYGAATGARLLAGLGGSLDVFSGQTRRAPKAFQKLGLEWFYRLCTQPSRIGRMARLPLFLCSAVAGRIRGA